MGGFLKLFVMSPTELTSTASGILAGSAIASFNKSNNESTFALVGESRLTITAAVKTLSCSNAAIYCSSCPLIVISELSASLPL